MTDREMDIANLSAFLRAFLRELKAGTPIKVSCGTATVFMLEKADEAYRDQLIRDTEIALEQEKSS